MRELSLNPSMTEATDVRNEPRAMHEPAKNEQKADGSLAPATRASQPDPNRIPSPLRWQLRGEIKNMGWKIGRGSYGRLRFIEKNMGRLEIGSFCSLADVTFAFGNNRFDCVTTFPFGVKSWAWPGYPEDVPDHASKGPIFVGSDVWIGSGAIIMSGVTIGDGCIVGAHSVVTKDIPPYSICAGNPARHIRYRFSAEQIDRLIRIKWWDWEKERINRYLPLLMADVERFLAAVEDGQDSVD